MRQFWHRFWRFLGREDGPTAVEYAFLLVLIIAVCVLAIAALGSNTKGSFTDSAHSIAS